MAPFEIVAALGKFMGYLVFLLIGVGFGAVLEMSGFGDSRKLAAQFYLKDMTVLKVMFTAIIVAMVLIFAFSALGWLDFGRVYVTETYLMPGIIGGLIMGVGFIVGGFCPGTSIVALATFKIDGFFFAGGVAFGVFLFGETVSIFSGFHNSFYMDRFILPELFGLPTGVVVLMVVFMALMMFYWAEISEKFFGEGVPWAKIKKIPSDTKKMLASAALVFIALFVVFAGQPSPEDMWARIEAVESKKLETREVFIHPAELLETMKDPLLYATMLDVRNETDFNLFHIKNSRRITMADIHDVEFIKDLRLAPNNTVVVVISNNDADAAEAYKLLKGLDVLNLYILDGGINHWLDVFPLEKDIAVPLSADALKGKGDMLTYRFHKAVGSTVHAANPELEHGDGHEIKYEKKIKIQKKKAISGGCG